MNRLLRSVLAFLWPLPYTLLGVVLGMAALPLGARARWRRPTLEVHGPGVARLLRRLPGGKYAAAITFGHVILGIDAAMLDAAREHELVHVRQYQRWGVLFGPAYLGSSLVLWLRGKDPYRDNVFEREAFDRSSPRRG